jgi:hypothetical protein
MIVTVRGSTSSNTFEGVLLIAKTPTSQQIIGTWSPVNASLQTLACNGIANTGVTHTSNVVKSEIEAIWFPPSTAIEQNTIIKYLNFFLSYVINIYNKCLEQQSLNHSL